MSLLRFCPFGKAGDTCTALGMGGGFPGFAGFDRSIATVRRAYELGIRLFDTSVMYQSGASQPILGEALSNRSEPHLLTTKVGYFAEASHFRSVEALHAQLRENLRLLRRERVDVLQVHEADWDNWWTDRPDVAYWELFDIESSIDFASAPVIQFLCEAKARGLCRYIGITGNNARHIGRLVCELDGLDSVLIAFNYQPLNVTAREHVIPPALARGMAIFVAGIFTFPFALPPSWRTQGTYFGKRTAEQFAQLHELQRDSGLSMPELVLRFVAADKQISSTLVGACHPHEIESNVAAFERGRLPADLHAAVEGIAAQFE